MESGEAMVLRVIDGVGVGIGIEIEGVIVGVEELISKIDGERE